MNKSDWGFLLALIATIAAGFVAYETRRKRGLRQRQPPAQPSGEEPPEAASAPAVPAVAPPSKGLTARERRLEEIVAVAQTDRCLYCTADAELPAPHMAFRQPLFDAAALFSGDLPRHWIVRSPSESASPPILCRAHATIARTSIELRIAELHADYVRFVAAQKETAHEFTAHGLDEAMRAEAERVRKGAAKGGT